MMDVYRDCSSETSVHPNNKPDSSRQKHRQHAGTTMAVASLLATGLVAAEHAYILAIQMFFWTTPRGRRAFGLTTEFAAQTKTLAKQQGLYNGFLAAGLAWGILHPDAGFAVQLRGFFLSCVVVAGVYGGLTSNPKILMVQAAPAAVALGAVLLGL